MSKNKLIIIAAIVTGGCVSISSLTSAHYQIFTVQTWLKDSNEIIGASCELSNKNGTWFLTSPGTVMIPRSNDDLQVTCRKEELEPGKATVVSEMKTLMYGNVLLGGGLGAFIDHSNGAAYEYPQSIRIDMGAFAKIEPSAASEPSLVKGKAQTTAPPETQTIPGAKSEPGKHASPQTIPAAESSKPAKQLPSRITDTDFASFSYKMVRGDECDDHVSNGDFCWWSPPGKYSACTISLTLKKCKSVYGKGCRIGYGKELPKC